MTAALERSSTSASVGRDPVWGMTIADWRSSLIAGRILLLQVMHPVIDAGVGEHSTFKTDPYGRLQRSTAWSIGYWFGGAHAEETAGALRRMHKPVGGVMKDGRRYHAWDAEAFHWVHASTMRGLMLARERFMEPLTRAEQERLFSEYVAMGRWLGINDRDLLPDLDSLLAWHDEFVHTKLVETDTAHDVLNSFRVPPKPPFPWLPRRAWRVVGTPLSELQLFVTTGLMEPHLRALLGLSWSAEDERRLERFARVVRLVFRGLPEQLRLNPVWRRARAEVNAGREPKPSARIRAGW